MHFQPRNHKRDLEIMFLRNVKGMTFTEIGRKYDISKSRVMQLYGRVMKERGLKEVNKKMGIGV